MILDRRRLALAVGCAMVLVVGSPFVGQIRTAVATALPGWFGPIVAGLLGAAVGGGVLLAAVRIRERLAFRYLAIASALVAGAVFSRVLRTNNASIDLVEAFHFVEYGFLTLLFYLACHPLGDAAALILPVLAGTLVGVLDEWFQWFVPQRVGELRDLVIDVAAVTSGLLFSVGVKPPARSTFVLHPSSPTRIGTLSVLVILAFALFVHSAFLGYSVRDVEIGTFRSRYTGEQLAAEARRRADLWREQPPIARAILSREDQYMSEALWHVVRRNEAEAAGAAFSAWRENRILETFFAPVLDTPSYVTRTGHRWSAAQRAAAERLAGANRGVYVSDAEPYPIYVWSKTVFWRVTVVAMAVVMAIGVLLERNSADRRSR